MQTPHTVSPQWPLPPGVKPCTGAVDYNSNLCETIECIVLCDLGVAFVGSCLKGCGFDSRVPMQSL